MEVVRENIDDLNAILKVKIAKEDYQDAYEKALKAARKQVQLPGFRPGHVPMSIIKKKYGASLLSEELDKLINQALYDYIKDNNLNILGQPIPVPEKSSTIDWKTPCDFEFVYEIGLAPEFEVKLNKKSKAEYSKVKIDDELVNKHIDDLARRHGVLEEQEESQDNDMILANFVEVDENNNPVEGGVNHTSSVVNEYFTDEDTKKKFVGLKIGDKLIIDPKKISNGVADMAAMLNISKEAAEKFANKVELTVEKIKRLKPANIDQELIDKIYGEGNVAGVEEFKEKIKEELHKVFSKDSDVVFKKGFLNKLRDKLKLKLPDTFLKKWIKLTNPELTEEQIEKEYDQYAETLRNQLIENKIMQEDNIKVTNEEAVEHVKELIGNQYAQYGMMIPEDAEMDNIAKSVLADEKEAKKVYDQLYDEKFTKHLKEAVKVDEKEMNVDDFYKKANEAVQA